MTATTESAPFESFANIIVNEECENREDEAFEDGLDDIEMDGITIEQIYPRLIKATRSTDGRIQLKATAKIRQLLEVQSQPMEKVIQPALDFGVLPAILDMAPSDDMLLLLEITWIVVNMTAGSTEQTSKVVEAGALPKFIPLFPTSDSSINQNILLMVGNILLDSKNLGQVAIREGGLKLALDVLRVPQNHSAECLGRAAWVMIAASTLEIGGLLDDELAAQMIAVLTSFIRNRGDKASDSLNQVVCALRQLSIHRNVTSAISEGGATRQIVRLCTEKDDDLRAEALTLVILMNGGGQDSLQALVDASCLSALDSCAAEQARSRGAALEDIAPLWNQALIALPLLPCILQTLSDSTETRTQRAKAASLTMKLEQVATINFEILDLMVEAGYLEAMSQAFLSKDPHMLNINLYAIERILNAKWNGRKQAVERFKTSDGPRCLRDLRVRRDTRKTAAATVARRVLQTHFPEFSKWPRV